MREKWRELEPLLRDPDEASAIPQQTPPPVPPSSQIKSLLCLKKKTKLGLRYYSSCLFTLIGALVLNLDNLSRLDATSADAVVFI